mgnify:FL=1
MRRFRSSLIHAGLSAMYVAGAHRWLAPLCAGVGAIFTLHHVRPARAGGFQPNRHLEITPDFLRTTLAYLRARGVDIITLDEMQRRLTAQDFSRRFACFTFDDGYRDNRDAALPVMREFDAPMTVFITSDFAAGAGRPWWIALERLIAANDAVEATINGATLRLDARTDDAKAACFAQLHDRLRMLPADRDLQNAIDALCARYRIDMAAISAELCMSWPELKEFARDPLVTLGAHSITHCNLAKIPREAARDEMAGSRAAIEAQTGRPVRHFVYPYGGRTAAGAREFELANELGFATAMTTQPGMIFAQNADRLTALPRVSLNGLYQEEHHLAVLASGGATAMANGFRRLMPA